MRFLLLLFCWLSVVLVLSAQTRTPVTLRLTTGEELPKAYVRAVYDSTAVLHWGGTVMKIQLNAVSSVKANGKTYPSLHDPELLRLLGLTLQQDTESTPAPTERYLEDSGAPPPASTAGYRLVRAGKRLKGAALTWVLGSIGAGLSFFVTRSVPATIILGSGVFWTAFGLAVSTGHNLQKAGEILQQQGRE